MMAMCVLGVVYWAYEVFSDAWKNSFLCTGGYRIGVQWGFCWYEIWLDKCTGEYCRTQFFFFKNIPKAESMNDDTTQAVVLCKVHALANYAPETAKHIETVYETTQNLPLVNQMFATAQMRFSDTGLFSDLTNCSRVSVPDMTPIVQTAYAWADSDEWQVLKSAFIRDQDTIRQAAHDAGISPRLLLGGIIGEQFRFFTSTRDSFKSYFEPLKILASLSKFSYGIAGLKPETVVRIEENLKNKNSVFYLGSDMENIITYPTGADVTQMQFDRITDTKNPYYSYLYPGLFMREVIAQWKAAGFDISNRPDVLSTLYNLGFNRSVPKAEPAAGGAPITVNGVQYNFGQLGYEFYYSGELLQEFPY
jgi:hypothetical protein